MFMFAGVLDDVVGPSTKASLGSRGLSMRVHRAEGRHSASTGIPTILTGDPRTPPSRIVVIKRLIPGSADTRQRTKCAVRQP